MALLKVLVVLGALACGVFGVNNGLARTPQMGWVLSNSPEVHNLDFNANCHAQNNWNALGCDVSESLLLDTAKELVHSGLRDLGYEYVVLDDCWSSGRGEDGFIRADAKKFPNGMEYVADQIHDLGLLYGMYSSAGEMTCARYGEKNCPPIPVTKEFTYR